MKRKSYSESQISNILKQVELGLAIEEVCRKFGISSATFYRWKDKYGTQKHKTNPYSLEASPKNYPKCNIFVYDVMEGAGVPMPHGTEGQKLTIHPLNQALSHDERFAKVWSRDSNENNWDKEKSRFLKTFHSQDGDIAIWDNPHLVHGGILEQTNDGHGNVYYAGSDNPRGVGYTNLVVPWINSDVKGYGAPDAIYRYKNFTN